MTHGVALFQLKKDVELIRRSLRLFCFLIRIDYICAIESPHKTIKKTFCY